MAFIRRINKDEEEVKTQQPAGSPLEVTSGGGQLLSAGATPSSQPAQKKMGPQNFVDVASYLDANRPQAQATGENIANRLSGEAATTRANVGKLAQKSLADIQAAKVATPSEQYYSGALSKPEEYIQDPANVEQFKKYREAAFTGPSSIEENPDYSTTFSQTQEGLRKSGLTGTAAGRKELLSGLMAKPTAGKLTLDELLLSQEPTSMGKVQEAAAQFAPVSDYLKEQSGVVGEAAKAAKAETEATKAKTAERLGGAVGSLQSDIDQRMASRISQQNAQTQALKDLVANEKSMTVQMPGYRQLGMSPSQWADLLNVKTQLRQQFGLEPDISPYIKQTQTPEAAYTRANVASPEEYAREAALETLAGSPYSVLNNADVKLAGTAPQNVAQFDIGSAYSDLRGKMTAQDKQLIDSYEGEMPSLSMYKATPETAKKFEATVRAFQRNPEKLNDRQKMWLDVFAGNKPSPFFIPGYKDWVNTYDAPSPTVGIPWAPPPAPKSGESKLKVIDTATGGKMAWWNGSEWVDAPQEFKNKHNPDDSWTTEKFNYETGKYEKLPDTPAGKTPPGIVRAF